MTRVAYGQVVFTPRHDAFIQASYVQKLRFGQRKQPPFPEGGPSYQVHGPGQLHSAPLPPSFRTHATSFALTQSLQTQKIYEEILSEAWP